MALIKCEKCGRTISDTTNKCIHCGEIVHKKNGYDAHDNSSSKDNSESIILDDFTNYKDLMGHKRIELELEFCYSDKWALKYVRKIHEPISILKIAGIADTFGLACYMAVVILIYTNPSWQPYNDKFFMGGIVLGIFTGIIGFATTILSLIFNKIHIKSVKKNLYYFKKFQFWLIKEKNIVFYPDYFATQEIKDKYDSITEDEINRL